MVGKVKEGKEGRMVVDGEGEVKEEGGKEW